MTFFLALERTVRVTTAENGPRRKRKGRETKHEFEWKEHSFLTHGRKNYVTVCDASFRGEILVNFLKHEVESR